MPKSVVHQRTPKGKHRLVIGKDEGEWVDSREVATLKVDDDTYHAVPDSDGEFYLVYKVNMVEGAEFTEEHHELVEHEAIAA
jgi:hypothetical protein